jgi:septal ring-binding cell division protein DamX
VSTIGGAQGWWSGRHPSAGTTRLLIGFVIGALFVLLPVHYFYMARDPGSRDASALEPSTVAPVDAVRAPSLAAARDPSKLFASRLTYELSHLPEERPAPPAIAPAAPAAPVRAPAPATVAPGAAFPEAPAERVANARPISAVPPDPRDRTREIEREALKAEYREPARATKPPSSPPPGRAIEGREIELKPRLPETPTRPITAGSAVDSRAEIEAEREKHVPRPSLLRSPAAADGAQRKPGDVATTAIGAHVAGVSPIARPAEAVMHGDTASGAKAPGAGSKAVPNGSDASPPASADVQTRLDSTREWLAAAPPATHTIQLMGANSEEQLKAHLKSLSKVLEPEKLYVFRTRAQGKPSITVVYGAYADRAAALQALEKLPAAITANRPVLRTVNGIRAELKQHKPEASEEAKK